MGFWWGKLEKKDRLEDLRTDGRKILKWALHKLEGVDWINLDQNRNEWRDLVNMVINLPSSIKCGEMS
jgi:hypothetical protein